MVVDAYNPSRAAAIQETTQLERVYKTDLVRLAQEAVETTPGTKITVSETSPDPKSSPSLLIMVDGPESFILGGNMLPRIYNKTLRIVIPKEIGNGSTVSIQGLDNSIKLLRDGDKTHQLPSFTPTWSLDVPHIITQEEKRALIEQGVKSLVE